MEFISCKMRSRCIVCGYIFKNDPFEGQKHCGYRKKMIQLPNGRWGFPAEDSYENRPSLEKVKTVWLGDTKNWGHQEITVKKYSSQINEYLSPGDGEKVLFINHCDGAMCFVD